MDNSTGYLLQHVANAMARQNDQVLLDHLNIGFSQFKILMVLERNPYVQQKDIAESLGQTEASISRQIKIMVDQGLLKTTIQPENRRRHITTPTAKGSRIAHEATQLLNRYHAPVFARLDAKDQRYLAEALTQMHESVCQNGKAGACDHPYNA